MKLGFRALRGALVVTLLASVVAPLAAAPAHAVAPSGVTTLQKPEPGATVGGSTTFSWTAVPGAAAYRFQVAKSPEFTTKVLDFQTFNVHATPRDALPVGDLYWRVAPTDGGSGVGAFTTGTFTSAWAEAPELLSPVNAPAEGLAYPEQPLLFTWKVLPGAQKYNVQIDDDVNFIGAVTHVTNNPSFTLTDPQTIGQSFYWRVQGVTGTGTTAVVSPWSETRTYHVNWDTTPRLTSPGVGDGVTDVVLEWDEVLGATTYQVQVSPAQDFSNNILVDVVVKGTRYSPPQTLDNGSYYWRVRARDGKPGTPNLGAWSSTIDGQPAQFVRRWIDRPVNNLPEDTDEVVFPTLTWSGVAHASHYEIQLSSDENFSPATITSCFTNQTSFTPYSVGSGYDFGAVPNTCGITPNRLPHGGRVFWRVRGIDAPGKPDAVKGEFSTPTSFTFLHDDVPLVTGPANGATVTDPVLSWQPVMGVARYRVSLSTGGSAVAGSPFITYGTTFTPDKLVDGKPYVWTVQTYDDQDRVGASVDARTFTYSKPLGLESPLALLGPPNATSSPLMPAMQWTPVIGADHYDVYFKTPSATLFTFLGRTESTSYTAPGLPANTGTYQWYVKALSSANVTLEDSPVGTFAVDPLPLVSGLLPAKCVDTTCAATPETPKLSWNRVPYAAGYMVYLSNDASFTNVVRVYKTQHNSVTPRESLLDSATDKAYYWFVVPCRDVKGEKGCGKFDNEVFDRAGAFRKRSLKVALTSPADNATLPATANAFEDVTFTWEEYFRTNNTTGAAQGAKQYRIEVSTTSDFKPLSIIDDQTVDQATYTPHGKTYPDGPIYWRVRAIDGSNNPLSVSDPRLVTKGTPPVVPTYPTPGAVVGTTPYFHWEPQPHVSSYEAEVYQTADTDFSPGNRVGLFTTRLTAYAPTTSLLVPGNYAWRVRRLDADARPGPWSSGGTFTLTTGTPTLLSPVSGAVFTSNEMLFTWNAVPGVARYQFEASPNAGFTTYTENVKTVLPAWAPIVKYPDGPTYWRVRALDAGDNTLAVSETWSILRDVKAPTVLSKTPTSSAAISGAAFTVTFSEPVKGLSETSFTMTASGSSTKVPGTVTPAVGTPTTTATFKPTGPLTPGETYTLRLTSDITDAAGNALAPMSWTVRTALTVDGLSPAVQQFWDRDSSTSASGGYYLASRAKGAKVTFSFTGTSAALLGRKAPDGGYGEVWVDGVKKSTVSFYSSTVRWKQTIWSATGLSNATHKVELRVLGTKPASATSSWVYPDAFRNGTLLVEETGAGVAHSHANAAYSSAMGGSYILATHTATGDTSTKPYVTMKFKGTGIAWRGYRRLDGGMARVYVDGVAKATIDTYGSTTSLAPALYNVSGLSNGTHTIKIELTGTKRSTSKGYYVSFDSFAVT